MTFWETYRRNKQTALSRLNRAVHVARKSVIKWKECMKKYIWNRHNILYATCPFFVVHICMASVSLRRDTCIRHHLHTRLAINAFLIVAARFRCGEMSGNVCWCLSWKFLWNFTKKSYSKIEENIAFDCCNYSSIISILSGCFRV